jgi:uncharacterized membrane protein
MPNKRIRTKIIAGFFLWLSFLFFAFGFCGWFFVPPDPAGNVHRVMTGKMVMGISGFVVAIISFVLSRVYGKRAAFESLEKENIKNV